MTSSDWTAFGLVDGATWLRPSVVSASPAATYAGPDGARFQLIQSLADANAGKTVEMIVDILVTGTEEGKPLVFEIERGHLGSTRVELSNYQGAEPVVVATFVWGGIASGDRNAHQFQVPLSTLLSGAP